MSDKTPNHALSEARCPVSLEDVDLFAPGAQEHWYEAYDILHREAPVHRLPGQGFLPGTDGFILSKHEDIAAVVRDQERFPLPGSLFVKQLVEAEGNPFDTPGVNVMLASMATLRPNPELWRTHRQELTDPWVGPGSSRHEGMVRDLANRLVEQWIDRGTLRFVAEFAQPLPHRVMANVLGWPEADLGLLKTFGDGCVKAFVYGRGHKNELEADEIAEQQKVLEAFKAYTHDLIQTKRAAPAEDMISFLTTVEYSPLKRRLTDGEINGIVYAMVIGGLETTQYALAEQVQLVIEHPHIWQALKEDRSKVRAFTEEGMRLRSPTQGLSTRITSQDEVFQGVAVPKGSHLHLRWASANIDPDEWDDPLTPRLDRKAGYAPPGLLPGSPGMPWGTLSRLEQVVAWNVLLDRVESFAYAEGNDFLHQPGIMLGTLKLEPRGDADHLARIAPRWGGHLPDLVRNKRW